jgi:hypothetical protein
VEIQAQVGEANGTSEKDSSTSAPPNYHGTPSNSSTEMQDQTGENREENQGPVDPVPEQSEQ